MPLIQCPRCASEARENRNLAAEEPFGTYCPECRVRLTAEGLVREEERQNDGSTLVREKGRNERVIYEYRDEESDVECLLRTLAQLKVERQGIRGDKVVAIEAQGLVWNHRAAVLRFRRWYSEHKNPPMEVQDAQTREAARGALKEEPEIDFSELLEDITADRDGLLTMAHNYELHKAAEPLLLLERLPEERKALIIEAREAYRHGLTRSTKVLCRAILEDAVNDAYKEMMKVGSIGEQYTQRPKPCPKCGSPQPSPQPCLSCGHIPHHLDFREKLDSLADADKIPEREKELAVAVRTACNEAAHPPRSKTPAKSGPRVDGETLTDFEILLHTSRIVELLLNRGSLHLEQR
jgi:hypothetical protein